MSLVDLYLNATLEIDYRHSTYPYISTDTLDIWEAIRDCRRLKLTLTLIHEGQPKKTDFQHITEHHSTWIVSGFNDQSMAGNRLHRVPGVYDEFSPLSKFFVIDVLVRRSNQHRIEP
jgi:hypothetical protein